MRLVILGVGGYANTVRDIAEQMCYEIVVMLDDKRPEYPLAAFTNYIAPDTLFIPSFGNNIFRFQWCERITESGGSLVSLVHPLAYVSLKASIGAGVVVLPHAVINTGTVVKEGCIINIGAIVDHDCILESGVHIAHGAIVKGENRVPSCEKIESGVVMVEYNFKWKNGGRTKVMIGCGTRSEIIRLAAVIKRCREYFDTCVVYYNQNWDRNLSTVFWEDFELRNTFGEFGPDILVPVVGENLGVTCGNIFGRSNDLLSELRPDGYIVLGDTNSCLSAISAKRLHIPLFHMEAGNRCKDECLPEETNRRIVDVISDVNLCIGRS